MAFASTPQKLLYWTMNVVFVFLYILVVSFCCTLRAFAQQDELNFKVVDPDQRLVDDNVKDSIFYFMEDAIKSPLRVSQLIIQGKHLQHLPQEVMKFKHLKVLDISHNRIADLPDSLFISCPSLTEIRYAGNELKVIPDVLCQPSLSVLDLSENDISYLDSNISRCLALEELDLHANDIDTFSSFISLINLKSLILSDNPVRQLGDWILNQPQLKILFVDNTQLKNFPAFICKADYLKLLNIEGNHLSGLPDCLCQMKSIKVMMIMEGNQMSSSLIENLVKCQPQLRIR
jgi:Leucine-rich repeat (LRR) protein